MASAHDVSNNDEGKMKKERFHKSDKNKPAPVPFTRQQLAHHEAGVLRAGRWAKPAVLHYRLSSGGWVVKDYAHCVWVMRWTSGLLSLRRELKALRRLAGIEGVPQDTFRVDKWALAYRMIDGVPVRKVHPGRLPSHFFNSAEALVCQMHGRQVVHLDMRNGGNLISRPDGSAGLIDFQTHIITDRLPRWLQNWFFRVDLSGVYKQWRKKSPQTLPEEKLEALDRIDGLRWLWPFIPQRKRTPPPSRPPN